MPQSSTQQFLELPRTEDTLHPTSVLLVEDDRVSAEIFLAYLRRLPLGRVESAADLCQALAVMAREDFDLVFTDLNLPDSSGIETVERLAAASRGVIIAITSDEDPALRDAAIAGGAYDFLHKRQINEATLQRLTRLAALQARTFRSLRESERLLRESERQFRQTFELAASGIAQVDGAGRFIRVNDALCRILGHAPEALVGQEVSEFLHPEERDAVRAQHARVHAGEADSVRAEVRYLRSDGATVWTEVALAAVRDAGDRLLYDVAVIDDITPAKQARARLAAHLRYQARVAALGRAALSMLDPDALIEAAVQSALECLVADAVAYLEPCGDADELQVRFIAGAAQGGAVRVAPAHGSPVLEVFRAGQQLSIDCPVLPLAWAQAGAAAVVPVRQGERVCGALCAVKAPRDALGPEELNFLDATASVLSAGLQRIDSESRLAFLAQFDPLTGLPNRALLADRCAQMIVQAQRHAATLGVLFIDLDEFKLVNDTLGHAAGNELLKECARRLQCAVRPGDTVARISGDEFAIVLANLGRPDDAALVAQKVIDGFGAPFEIHGVETFITASIGVAIHPADGGDADKLLTAGEAAMYRAKQSGRNAFQFFTAEINQRARARASLGGELRRALERGEFTLFYQPKYDLKSRIACGGEALLRWNHPERGLISPAQFVPVLEDTGLIVPVGEWALARACEDVRRRLASGRPALAVAVNLSARQFRLPDLDARIRRSIGAAGIDPELIQLEITESQLMHDPDHAIRVMRSLRDAGIAVAIDDFGTGYSSLAYLTRFPLAALKIDRSFVQDMLNDSNHAAIVRTIIEMAHTLGFTVIAEGIETEPQAKYLRQLGCEQGQGYLFARPMPAEEFNALI